MASALFDPGREGILDDTISMTGDIRVMLVKSTYIFDVSDKFLADLGVVDNGRTTALQNKLYASGVFSADNISLTTTDAVACNALIVFLHTGSDSTARVIAYVDTASAGLPFTPSASQTVNLLWDTGANKIFKL